jgi:glycosyltransferase involved in cell wall biosynthesis
LRIVGISDISQYHADDDIGKNITCIKYVEKNEDFHQLIYGAKLFLFLSIIEGFGFPPIEAMQLNTPVICSDRSSLPEVVGDAAVMVDPENYTQVAKAMNLVLDEKYDREDLCSKGRLNIKRFNWEKTGNEYRKVLLN